jgi:predicted outer membrane repeat protein
MATATIATSVAVNVTTSIVSTTNISTTPTDYTTAIANGGIASTNIASTIASWTSLSSSITAAAGTAVTLTLSTPFAMTGHGGCIKINTAQTHITIVGNGAIFDQKKFPVHQFFSIQGKDVTLVMSNVTMRNGVLYGLGGAISVLEGTVVLSYCSFSENTGNGGDAGAIYVGMGGTIMLSSCNFSDNEGNDDVAGYGGAILVDTKSTATLSNCSFSGNSAPSEGGAICVQGTITLSDCTFSGNNVFGEGNGGAIYVSTGGTATLSDCIFSGNTAQGGRYWSAAGGALYFASNSTGLLKNCSLLGTVSPNVTLARNDIARDDTTANVTFACADGEVGTPVQMSGTEITKIPALTCTVGNCFCRNSKCVVDPAATLPCTKCQTPGACV